MKLRCAFLLGILALTLSCSSGSGRTDSVYRPFPQVKVPSVCETAQEQFQYALDHYWDSYFSGDGITDSTAILGVKKEELEAAFSQYLSMLGSESVTAAATHMAGLFRHIELCEPEKADSSLAYLRLTELVSRYLYDPNSPMRCEDLYLPFVSAMAASPRTRDDMRTGYEYQARMCSLNQFGQVVPDFSFKDAQGTLHRLHDIKAGYTMLFFSNPGCTACKTIIDEVVSRPYVDMFIADGLLAVVNIYIDQEIDKWREYEPTYPRNWLTGYDHLYRLRESGEYDIRAIPYLFLLDKDKRVILKDAPTERVMAFLDNIYTQYYGNNQ